MLCTGETKNETRPDVVFLIKEMREEVVVVTAVVVFTVVSIP